MKSKSEDIGAKDDGEHADFFGDLIIRGLGETSKSMLGCAVTFMVMFPVSS